MWWVFVRQLQEGRILSRQNYGVKRSERPIRFWFAVSLQLVFIGLMSVCWVLTLFALAYVGHAAYLWKQYGPPTGFCTKCFIYWGKHRVSGGNTHWCEHAPLHWSVSGNKQEE